MRSNPEHEADQRARRAEKAKETSKGEIGSRESIRADTVKTLECGVKFSERA